MSGVSVRITSDMAPALRALERLRQAGDDLSPAWNIVGMELVKGVHERFLSETAPGGAKWTPLSAAWKARKARRVNPVILRYRNHLYSSIAHAADTGGVVVGTNRIYARLHERGGEVAHTSRKGTAYKVFTPARPFLPDIGRSERDVRTVIDALTDYLTGAFHAVP